MQNINQDRIEEDDSTRIRRQQSGLNATIQSIDDESSSNNREQLTPSPSRMMRPASFIPPFPVQPPPSPTNQQSLQSVTPTTAPATSQTNHPLTNHEIYEMIQKNQQAAAAAAAAAATGSGQSALIQSHPISSGGSFKQTKSSRQSSYNPTSRFERQDSIIVGTPGFREKYGK